MTYDAEGSPPAENITTPAAEQPLREYAFRFHGRAGEYFGIWIVNTVLTLLTLGVYSAWAKVRKHRYFYQSLELDDASFRYLANPMQILKGRIIAVLVFAVYFALSSVWPPSSIIFGLLFLFVLPWLVTRSMVFRARYSVYRNVRFNFKPNYNEAVNVFSLLPIATAFTLGLLYPYMQYRQKSFVVAQSCYGRQQFSYTGAAGDFYKLYMKSVLVLLVLLALAGLFSFALSSAYMHFFFDPMSQHPDTPMPPVIGMIMPLLLMPVYVFVGGYLRASVLNTVYNHTHLAGARLQSGMNPLVFGWIYLTNSLAILLSLGLLTPWAEIRAAQYRAECLSLLSPFALDGFSNDEWQEQNALAEEGGEIFDVDIGI